MADKKAQANGRGGMSMTEKKKSNKLQGLHGSTPSSSNLKPPIRPGSRQIGAKTNFRASNI